ncbi:hypothetical protein Scep_013414 [Stephania cephalantha]|uniref:Uncharacterized protein n=1 Tax=Stephania cephalantha TaxID=152367 RepID=A0AAP0PAR7_9MAGN
MDLATEELQFLSVAGIVRESVRIPGQSNRIFSLITLTLINPLSLCILTHTLFTHPILRRVEAFHSAYDLAALIAIQFLYLIFLFLFSLLSTAAVVLSVASLYSSSKPPSSFSSLLSSALPRAFPRLARTFLFVSLLMLLYNLLFLGLFFLLALSYRNSTSIVAAFVVMVILYFALHVYITAWWHLASVVSVMEPVCGWAAMRRSRELLRGKAGAAAALVSVYLVACGVISGVFGGVVVRGWGGWGGVEGFGGRGLGWGLGCGQFGWVVGAKCVLLCLQELPS